MFFHRVTINTPNNLLVLNFESVEYDYTLEDDKMPPMVQYSKYSDAPIRHQPYAYVRAQRMKRADATNRKILHPDGGKKPDCDTGTADSVTVRILVQKPSQISHSAKSLSERSMQEAKRLHSASVNSERARSSLSKKSETHGEIKTTVASAQQDTSSVAQSPTANNSKLVGASASKPPSKVGTKSKVSTSFKTTTMSLVSMGVFPPKKSLSDSDAGETDGGSRHRRVSWAFEKPPLQSKPKELSLNETKALLRSQMRAKGEVVPPDFIYLAVNSIQVNMKPSEANKNLELNRRQMEINKNKQFGRPTSSPSRIDPRTKIPVEDLNDWEHFRMEHGTVAYAKSETGSKVSARTSYSSKSKEKEKTCATPAPTTQAYFTDFTVTPVITKTVPSKISSTIPRGRVIRPHTAANSRTGSTIKEVLGDRPHSAGTILQRPDTAVTSMSGVPSGVPVYGVPHETKRNQFSTSASGISHVPMLMYSRDITEKIQRLSEKRKERMSQDEETTPDPTKGRVSAYNSPMRTHAEFKLRTHEQVQKDMIKVAKADAQRKKNKEAVMEHERKQAWLERVKSASSMKSSQSSDKEKLKISTGPTKTVVIVT